MDLLNCSLKYLKKSLNKIEQNQPVNVKLLESINQKYKVLPYNSFYLYGENVKQVEKISYVELEELKEKILLIIEKLTELSLPSGPPLGSPLGPPSGPPEGSFVLSIRHSIRLDFQSKVPITDQNWPDRNIRPFNTPLLEPDGINLAKNTAIEIKNYNLQINKIVSSPLRRCLQTALQIALVFNINEITIDYRIIEDNNAILDVIRKHNNNPKLPKIPERTTLMSEQHIKNIFDKYKINIIFPKSNTSAGLLPDILSDNPERRYTEAYNEYKSMVNYNTCLVSHGSMVFHQLIAVGGSHHGSPNYCAWIARFKNEYLLDLSKLIKNNQTQAGLVRGPSGPP